MVTQLWLGDDWEYYAREVVISYVSRRSFRLFQGDGPGGTGIVAQNRPWQDLPPSALLCQLHVRHFHRALLRLTNPLARRCYQIRGDHPAGPFLELGMRPADCYFTAKVLLEAISIARAMAGIERRLLDMSEGGGGSLLGRLEHRLDLFLKVFGAEAGVRGPELSEASADFAAAIEAFTSDRGRLGTPRFGAYLARVSAYMTHQGEGGYLSDRLTRWRDAFFAFDSRLCGVGRLPLFLSAHGDQLFMLWTFLFIYHEAQSISGLELWRRNSTDPMDATLVDPFGNAPKGESIGINAWPSEEASGLLVGPNGRALIFAGTRSPSKLEHAIGLAWLHRFDAVVVVSHSAASKTVRRMSSTPEVALQLLLKPSPDEADLNRGRVREALSLLHPVVVGE